MNPTTTKSDFVDSPVYYKEKSPSGVEKVRKMRKEESGRYTEEINKALDDLLKKPKSEWPKLLKK